MESHEAIHGGKQMIKCFCDLCRGEITNEAEVVVNVDTSNVGFLMNFDEEENETLHFHLDCYRKIRKGINEYTG